MRYERPEIDSKGRVNHKEHHRREDSRIQVLLGSFRGADLRKISDLEEVVEESSSSLDEGFIYGSTEYDLKPKRKY